MLDQYSDFTKRFLLHLLWWRLSWLVVLPLTFNDLAEQLPYAIEILNKIINLKKNSISVFVHRVAVWYTNTWKSVRMSQNAVNARKSWREFVQHVHWNVHAFQNVKRPLPVHMVVFYVINASVNVSFALSSSRNKRSSKCYPDHQNSRSNKFTHFD